MSDEYVGEGAIGIVTFIGIGSKIWNRSGSSYNADQGLDVNLRNNVSLWIRYSMDHSILF